MWCNIRLLNMVSYKLILIDLVLYDIIYDIIWYHTWNHMNVLLYQNFCINYKYKIIPYLLEVFESAKNAIKQGDSICHNIFTFSCFNLPKNKRVSTFQKMHGNKVFQHFKNTMTQGNWTCQKCHQTGSLNLPKMSLLFRV